MTTIIKFLAHVFVPVIFAFFALAACIEVLLRGNKAVPSDEWEDAL